MRTKLIGYLKLTRFNEYVSFVTVTTLLGVAAAGGELSARWWLVLIANLLSVGFAFMINDVEDAPDDALSAAKINRNPVSSGQLTPTEARIASFVVALFSLMLYIILGGRVLFYGAISLVLGILYSWHGVRLKQIAFLDLLSHCWLLAGLQTLTGFFTFSQQVNRNLIFPLAFIICISLYGELFNELRDFEGDKAANLRHTAIVLGEKRTHILMMVLLGLGAISGFITIVLLNIIPGWVIVFMAVMAVILIFPALLRLRQNQTALQIQTPLHKPLEIAAAIALFSMYIVPPMIEWIKSL
jgi:4-hydroxybenzoate polyprenyltransferase